MLTSGSIRLGVMPPLTGLVEIYGQEITLASQIACREVNESGGVLGRPLELIIENDGSLPESAVSAAKKLVDQHCCVAIIGNLLSNSRISVAYRVAEPRKIPYLNFSFYEGSISSRYFFHFAALPNQQIDKMIPYMQKMYGPKMFFAGNNYEWPRGSIDAAKLALEVSNGKVVGEEYYPIGIGLNDIDRLLDNVSKSGADVFVPYFAGIDQVHLLTAFTSKGLKKRMAVVMGHYDEVMASHLPSEVREGFYSSNTYFMSVDTPENRRYLERLNTMPGITGIWPQGNGILTNFGEGTYLCVKAFALAANMAGSVESEALINALETISLTGPQGTVQMDPATHHAKVNTYLTCCQADGTFKIIEHFGAIDPLISERYRHFQMSEQTHLDEDIRVQARMLEQMTEAVFLVDAKDGTIVYTNPSSERMFGYKRGELIGKYVSTLNAPSDKTPEEIAEDINSILYRKGVWRGEILNIKKDGSTFWCSASVAAFTHARHGEVWMSVYKDVTERKRAEEELRMHREHLEILVKDRTAQLEAANKELEAFSYSVSHDLRAPLRSLTGFSEMLAKRAAGTLDEKNLHYLNVIAESAKQMGRLIDDLLSFSRMGRSEMMKMPVSIDRLVKEAVKELEAEVKERDIVWEIGQMPDVYGDQSMLKLVVVNLVSNALKFTRTQPQAKIEIGSIPDGQDEISFYVKDNGVGFDMQYEDKLFGIFQRLHRQDEFEGTGIGLANVKRIVQRHGGRVWAEGKVDEGATFYFTLPKKEGEHERPVKEDSAGRGQPE